MAWPQQSMHRFSVSRWLKWDRPMRHLTTSQHSQPAPPLQMDRSYSCSTIDGTIGVVVLATYQNESPPSSVQHELSPPHISRTSHSRLPAPALKPHYTGVLSSSSIATAHSAAATSNPHPLSLSLRSKHYSFLSLISLDIRTSRPLVSASSKHLYLPNRRPTLTTPSFRLLPSSPSTFTTSFSPLPHHVR